MKSKIELELEELKKDFVDFLSAFIVSSGEAKHIAEKLVQKHTLAPKKRTD